MSSSSLSIRSAQRGVGGDGMRSEFASFHPQQLRVWVVLQVTKTTVKNETAEVGVGQCCTGHKCLDHSISGCGASEQLKLMHHARIDTQQRCGHIIGKGGCKNLSVSMFHVPTRSFFHFGKSVSPREREKETTHHQRGPDRPAGTRT